MLKLIYKELTESLLRNGVNLWGGAKAYRQTVKINIICCLRCVSNDISLN